VKWLARPFTSHRLLAVIALRKPHNQEGLKRIRAHQLPVLPRSSRPWRLTDSSPPPTDLETASYTLSGVLGRPVAGLLIAPPLPPSPPVRHAPRHERESHRRRQRRVARYEAVLEAYRQGTPLTAIAQQVELARNTFRRYVRAECFPEHAARRQRRSQLTPFEGYHRARWNAGEQNAAALFREIQAHGYRGSASTLREHLCQWRTEPRLPGRRPHALTGHPAPPPVRTFSARQNRWLLVGARGAHTQLVDPLHQSSRVPPPCLAFRQVASRATQASGSSRSARRRLSMASHTCYRAEDMTTGRLKLHRLVLNLCHSLLRTRQEPIPYHYCI
jgi:hypothetical protein